MADIADSAESITIIDNNCSKLFRNDQSSQVLSTLVCSLNCSVHKRQHNSRLLFMSIR